MWIQVESGKVVDRVEGISSCSALKYILAPILIDDPRGCKGSAMTGAGVLGGAAWHRRHHTLQVALHLALLLGLLARIRAVSACASRCWIARLTLPGQTKVLRHVVPVGGLRLPLAWLTTAVLLNAEMWKVD